MSVSTETKDTVYNLVSIIYHALQGAETYEQYIRDAEKSNDQELVQFFHEVCDQNKRIAKRAIQLLSRQLEEQASSTATG